MSKTEDHIDYQIRETASIFAENQKPNANKRKLANRAKKVKTDKPQCFGAKTEKPDLKIGQNRKTENPSVPLFYFYWHEMITVHRCLIREHRFV